MTKRIIYTNHDGGVSIVIPAPNSGLTVDKIAAKDVPDGVAFEIVDTAAIPTERTFRNAWRRNGAAVETDIPAARLIAHVKRRAARDAAMAPLDIKATIPTEADKAEVDRVALRVVYANLQTDIDAASSEGELLAITKLQAMQT